MNNVYDVDVGYIDSEYYDWLIDRILPYNRWADVPEPPITYYDLLHALYNIPYEPFLDDDEHRYADGIALRERFAIIANLREEEEELLTNWYECSVLEMMVALALKCEEQIMHDPEYGSRTKQWFWFMIRSLGLNKFCDAYMDKHPEAIDDIKDIVERFMRNEYKPNGEGGLFIVDCGEDLSKKSIWYQLMRYLDTIP